MEKNEREDQLDQLLHEAAREEIPALSEDMTDRVMGDVNTSLRKKPVAAVMVGIAASITILVVHFLPSSGTGENENRAVDLASTPANEAPEGMELNLPTPRISLGMMLPETEKALNRNRANLISYARAVQTSTLIFSGGEVEE